MRQQLTDFGFEMKNVPIFCDNTSVIQLSKTPILDFRTKHIDIKYYFLGDNVNTSHIKIEFIYITNLIANIFTKSLEKKKKDFYKERLG